MFLFKKEILRSLVALVIFPTYFFAGISKNNIGCVIVIIKNGSGKDLVGKITRNSGDGFGVITTAKFELKKDGK